MTDDTLNSSALAEALATLQEGDLVAIPTETVYGLAADALNTTAVEKIFALKGRPPSRPLIVHIASADSLDEWAIAIPDYARKLAKAFWPGPLALVLPRQSRVLDAVTGGQDTVALRVPDHPTTLALLQAFDSGLAAPSANRYGRISPTTADHVRAEFGDATPAILDGGACKIGIESTIVSCLGERPAILRPGQITASEIAEVTDLAVTGNVADGSSPKGGVVVPGQVASHYAPVTPTRLLTSPITKPVTQPGERTGFLGFNDPGWQVTTKIILPQDPGAAGQSLYAALRSLDAANLDQIWIEPAPNTLQWAGIQDRLTRAAG